MAKRRKERRGGGEGKGVTTNEQKGAEMWRSELPRKNAGGVRRRTKGDINGEAQRNESGKKMGEGPKVAGGKGGGGGGVRDKEIPVCLTGGEQLSGMPPLERGQNAL